MSHVVWAQLIRMLAMKQDGFQIWPVLKNLLLFNLCAGERKKALSRTNLNN